MAEIRRRRSKTASTLQSFLRRETSIISSMFARIFFGGTQRICLSAWNSSHIRLSPFTMSRIPRIGSFPFASSTMSA